MKALSSLWLFAVAGIAMVASPAVSRATITVTMNTFSFQAYSGNQTLTLKIADSVTGYTTKGVTLYIETSDGGIDSGNNPNGQDAPMFVQGGGTIVGSSPFLFPTSGSNPTTGTALAQSALGAVTQSQMMSIQDVYSTGKAMGTTSYTLCTLTVNTNFAAGTYAISILGVDDGTGETQNSTITNGTTPQNLVFGGGNIVLTSTPEPATLGLLAVIGVPGLLARRRRAAA